MNDMPIRVSSSDASPYTVNDLGLKIMEDGSVAMHTKTAAALQVYSIEHGSIWHFLSSVIMSPSAIGMDLGQTEEQFDTTYLALKDQFRGKVPDNFLDHEPQHFAYGALAPPI